MRHQLALGLAIAFAASAVAMQKLGVNDRRHL
jgi:hypothetical protein